MRLALAIISALATKTEPIGAPRPFDKQIEIESKAVVIFFTSTPCEITALNSRAPSR